MSTVPWRRPASFAVSFIIVSLTSIFAFPRVPCCSHGPKLWVHFPVSGAGSCSQKNILASARCAFLQVSLSSELFESVMSLNYALDLLMYSCRFCS